MNLYTDPNELPYHVFPGDEQDQHDLESTLCTCDPELKEVNGCLVVIHNSRDGREAVEWANEILKNS